MVVSIYICEIPKNVNKKDIESLFDYYEGYIETRLKPSSDSRKIAFVDFEEEAHAHFAIENLQGFRFSPEDKGLILKISDNSKNGKLQKDKEVFLGQKREKDSKERDIYRYKERNDRSSGPSVGHSASTTFKQDEKTTSTPASNSNLLDVINLLAGMANPQSNVSQPQQPAVQTNVPTRNNFNNNPYTIHETQQPTTENNTNFMDMYQNIQALQLLTSIANNTQNNPQPSSSKRNFSTSFLQYDENLKGHIDIKKNATNIVYVEGLPTDASEREVSHIFRPFPGFKSVRLITREKKGEKSVLCFADFEDVNQSTICINTLQGYRFDKNDLIGLHFSYGISKFKR
jgi:RNA recognition motif-containing protein